MIKVIISVQWLPDVRSGAVKSLWVSIKTRSGIAQHCLSYLKYSSSPIRIHGTGTIDETAFFSGIVVSERENNTIPSKHVLYLHEGFSIYAAILSEFVICQIHVNVLDLVSSLAFVCSPTCTAKYSTTQLNPTLPKMIMYL